MNKSAVDMVLYGLCCCWVGATCAVRHGIIEYSQFLTLMLAGFTVGITVLKSKKDDDDNERKDK